MSSNKEFLKTFLHFPTVTICPYNIYDEKKIENLAGKYNVKPKEFVDEILSLMYDGSEYTLEILEFFKNEGINTMGEFARATTLVIEDVRDTDVKKTFMNNIFYQKHPSSSNYILITSEIHMQSS